MAEGGGRKERSFYLVLVKPQFYNLQKKKEILLTLDKFPSMLQQNMISVLQFFAFSSFARKTIFLYIIILGMGLVQFYRKDTEHLYHAFMYSIVIYKCVIE